MHNPLAPKKPRLNLDEFERIIAYKAMFDTAYLTAIIDYIKPVYFKTKSIATVFDIIKTFYTARDKLPTVTEIKLYIDSPIAKASFKELVTSFHDIDKNLDSAELYANTEQFIKEKSVYHTMLDVANDLSKNSVDTSSVLAKFEQACSINLAIDRGLDLYTDIDRITTDLNAAQSMISTKWPWLDEALGGGFIKDGKSLYLFLGESNIGKSIVLGNIAANIANQGKTVLLISLEMSELLYARRICSNVTKIPLKDLKSNAATLKQLMKEDQEATGGRILIKEFPPSTITPNQLKAFIKRIIDSGVKIDAIVIDYINLIHSPIGSNSYERIKHVAEQVRAMTYTFACPIISASQIGRAGYNVDNPGMETVSESIGLVATSDVIGSIYQQEGDREAGIIRMGLPKNRYGPRGMTQIMRIDYSNLSIYQSDEDEIIEDDNNAFNALALLAE